MKKVIVIALMVCALLGVAPARVAASSAVDTLADVGLLQRAVLTLSLELNKQEGVIVDLTQRLDKALQLYDEAEQDVTRLHDENQELRLKLDRALLLYDGAEADIDLLQVQLEELAQEVEAKKAEIEAYKAAMSARSFLMLIAGAVGGAAAALLFSLLSSK